MAILFCCMTKGILYIYGISLLDTSRWKWHIYMNEFVIQMRWFLKFTKRSKFKTIKHHVNKRVGYTHNIKGIRLCVMRNNENFEFLAKCVCILVSLKFLINIPYSMLWKHVSRKMIKLLRNYTNWIKKCRLFNLLIIHVPKTVKYQFTSYVWKLVQAISKDNANRLFYNWICAGYLFSIERNIQFR